MTRVSGRQRSIRFVKRKLEITVALGETSQNERDSDSTMSSKSSGYSSSSDGSSSDDDFNFEDSDTELLNLKMLESPADQIEFYSILVNTRYHENRFVTPKSNDFCRNFFSELPEKMFRQIVRMDKRTFFSLVDLIQDHPIFQNQSWHLQAPPEWQLAVTLDRLGHNGNGACLSRMIPTWGVSSGTLVNFSKRCFIALDHGLKNHLKWPHRSERKSIQAEFERFGFPGCVGLIDGSLLPLSQRPHISGECYFDRKSRYSINTQVVCDHRRKILFLFTGMPGSCADVTCLRKSALWCELHHGTLFESGQYLLGDSGYSNLPHLVASFKRSDTDVEKEDFNSCVAKARVTNEHCIGVLKSRWFSLKELRVQLNVKKDSFFMVQWIGICAKLHNYVIAMNDLWSEEDGEIIIEHDDDTAENQIEQGPNMGGAMLQSTVMEHALEFNRRPGGFLSDFRE